MYCILTIFRLLPLDGLEFYPTLLVVSDIAPKCLVGMLSPKTKIINDIKWPVNQFTRACSFQAVNQLPDLIVLITNYYLLLNSLALDFAIYYSTTSYTFCEANES